MFCGRKMHGRVNINFCMTTVIQSLLFSIIDNITSLYLLPSNQFTQFFINTILCVTMATTLVTDILQNVWLCAADYNEVYMNRTLFILIAFNYLILTFKAKYHIFLENLIF